MYDYRSHWVASLERDWLSALCRLLLRARSYRHGGAVLLTPDTSEKNLRVKYRLQYPRLRTALFNSATATIKRTYAADEIHGDYLDGGRDELPIDLYLDESINDNEVADIDSEIDGALWFAALLTRVDGLVLATPRLEVTGFGVEITADDVPNTISCASDPSAEDRQAIEYTHYGTRHRSMMRYCYATPGSIGFVISQDGDVRAMLRIEDEVVVWENLKLQLHNFNGDADDEASETLTPEELAVQIWGQSREASRSSGARSVRRVARELFPGDAPGRGRRWHLTLSQADAIIRRFSS